MALKYRILLLGAVISIAFLAINTLDVFPLPKDDVLKEKTEEFSGVLRLWISEENSPSQGGLASWLTRESERFEKEHDGVYVQITPVSKETLSAFSYKAEFPPEMIVFSPGTLSDMQGLVRTENSSLLKEDFKNYASGYCTPIAMGACFWAVRESADGPLSGKTLLFDRSHLYPGLYALKSDLGYQKAPGMRYGVDLGLPIYNEEESEITEEAAEIIPGGDSRIAENACASFINGEGNAVFLSHRELSSLINASAAPEFEIVMTGEIYADLLSLFAITDTNTAKEKRMCEKFLDHLLSEDAQKRLESAKAFSVTEAQIYAGKTHYQEIEMFLSAMKIHPAPAFAEEADNVESLLEAIIRGNKPLREILP